MRHYKHWKLNQEEEEEVETNQQEIRIIKIVVFNSSNLEFSPW